MAVRGECSRCGILIEYGDPADDMYPATLFMTVPGRGAFARTVWQAELICKNHVLCVERQHEARSTIGL
jgi:hypothetical protein